MRFSSSRAFEKILSGLHPKDKLEAQRKIDAFARAMEARQMPQGLRIKKLRENLWEFRITLAFRALFKWQGDSLEFLFLGNHNQVRQFLQHYN